MQFLATDYDFQKKKVNLINLQRWAFCNGFVNTPATMEYKILVYFLVQPFL